MRCRQSKAERLTALALGYTLADAIRSARGRLTPMASARAAADAGDWQEAHRITHDALLSALGEAHDALSAAAHIAETPCTHPASRQ